MIKILLVNEREEKGSNAYFEDCGVHIEISVSLQIEETETHRSDKLV